MDVSEGSGIDQIDASDDQIEIGDELTDPGERTQLFLDLKSAMERLPGPPYSQVLAWIHQMLEPANYVEIGVAKGVSLYQAIKGTPCIGIDPAPRLEWEPPYATIYELTSDEFFARHRLDELLGGPVALAFIDGLHHFEQVLTDFVNLERHSDPQTVIVLHDCLPLDRETAQRERQRAFYSGDVWKAVLALHRERPDLEMAIVPARPTGLCLVRGLDSGNRSLAARLTELTKSYLDLDFDYYLAHRAEMPNEMANEEDAVRGWLQAGSG